MISQHSVGDVVVVFVGDMFGVSGTVTSTEPLLVNLGEEIGVQRCRIDEEEGILVVSGEFWS